MSNFQLLNHFVYKKKNRPLSKFALAGEIDDFSADFCSSEESHTQRVDDEQEQKFAKKGDLNSQMEFRKRSTIVES